MTLPDLWFGLCALSLGAFVILDGFDLGAGAVSWWLARDRNERLAIVHAIGPVWDGNEVWLITGAATLLMAFPAALSLTMSGFYLPMMMVLWLLMLRALGIEMQHLWQNHLWEAFWQRVFAGASLLLVVVFGLSIGNVLRGFDFAADGTFFVPLWTGFLPQPPVGILDTYTVPVAVFATALVLTHGLYWLSWHCTHDLAARALRWGQRGTALTLLLFLGISGWTATLPFGLHARIEQSPWGLALPMAFVAAALWTWIAARRHRPKIAFVGSILQVAAALAAAAFRAYPEIVPGIVPGQGLSIVAAASSDEALAFALTWWLPGLALAVSYFAWSYRNLGLQRHG